ncbi:SepM family pheromone-processing serine protease [Sporosarcina sp. G11-34]|uniref:SepM family pheromone-processing serine protease n=1 Tax=Sporosarcina sp. G11-34 TaxID=2849605 RepID=UPI0022A93A98|nr:SepM family pheromone-processing serine protease [Sporosarcina sp. G11-34]MCZ2257129.1 PDZ domain-containing protein [Sporosarcina sp. G11-34]
MRMKRIGSFAIMFIIIAALFVYPMDIYISKPGGAYDLAPLVEVIGGDEDDIGTFSLMTISLSKATVASYVYSQFSDKRKVLPATSVRRTGEDDNEYNVRQSKLMSDSQFNAITVAFEKNGQPVDIEFDGVFVMSVLNGGASDGLLEAGDKIRFIDGDELEESGAFVEIISQKKLGDEVVLTLERDKKQLDVTVTLAEIPGGDGRVGLGIGFEEDRILTTDPEVIMHTSNIGGPSAGFMFTLEIMNRLIDDDITKGYNIAGTGEILEDGTIGRIGGADFKVIAASKDGMEIFFAPDDDLPEEVLVKNPDLLTNYEEAKKMAEQIGTEMKVVPVKTIDDALDYLDNLELKK